MDYPSVQVLELACPKMSENDARMINQRSFGTFLNGQQQDSVKERVFEIDTFILSFRSLFEDLNYLELLVNALKKLHRHKKEECSFCRSLNASTPTLEVRIGHGENSSSTLCAIFTESMLRLSAIPV